MNLAGTLAGKPLSTTAKNAVKSLAVVFSKETDIYFNLSLENYLLSTFGSGSQSRFGPGSPLVYLWRNSPCVIVGRNQNVWSECNLDNIKNDVNIVRRFTGGGAVYQVGCRARAGPGKHVLHVHLGRRKLRLQEELRAHLRSPEQADRYARTQAQARSASRRAGTTSA